MGTMINLTLNGIDIDWGKNRYWRSHYWLFPPGSLTEIDNLYAHDVVERKPGFETTLDEALFRMCHLGYSQHETEEKFNGAVSRWNRTASLRLSYADFSSVLTELDFGALTHSAMRKYIWDFRAFLYDLLQVWDTEEALLEDFIEVLDFTIVLRALADRPENRSFPLRWHHQDLIDSGWASFDDLTEVDRRDFIINHTMLVGRLQDHARATSIGAFDSWLVNQGLARATPYVKIKPDGTLTREVRTLPSAVRNMIHHPENPHNVLPDEMLRESVECLLSVARALATPLPGLE